MQFLKGLTRFFHFEKEPAIIGKTENAITRRSLLLGLGATAIAAAMPKIPLGRVWSIPKKIAYRPGGLTVAQIVALQLEDVNDAMPYLIMHPSQLQAYEELGHQMPMRVSSCSGDMPRGPIPKGIYDGPLNVRRPFDYDMQMFGSGIHQPGTLLDRYGNALAGKLDRTIVEPVRSELEDVLELVGV